MRNTVSARAALLVTLGAACCGGATAQDVIDVPLAQPLNRVALGTGGEPPVVTTTAQSPTGVALTNLQPTSYAEWKVACQTPGLYRIQVLLAQWQDPGTALAFETRTFVDPEEPFATRYATPDTRDYGQTNGTNHYMDLGDVEDAAGNTLLVPLWSGENVLRVQNITGRHHPAERVPTDMSDPRNREWDTLWSGARIARIRLTRAGDLPAFSSLSGRVEGDRPAGVAARRALVLANPPGGATPEPSQFWKSGYYTLTRDDGTYTLAAPVGEWDVKAGRPGSYRVQGSDTRTVSLAADAPATADFTLQSLFHDNGQGRQVAELHMVYADRFTGNVAILPQSGENGYKVGWFHVGDACSVIVDAPRTGYYDVVVAYLNGGNAGTGRITTDRNQTITGSHPVTSWERIGYSVYAQPLYLEQGPNLVTQSLVSGDSDMNAIHLIAPPVTATDALSALRIAAGLQAATANDQWMGTITGDAAISMADAARLLQAANGQPL